MAEQRIERPGSVGRYWRQFRAGYFAGAPLAEWAYTSPRFPEGIVQSALRNVPPEVQREIAFVWFSLNLEPYALGEGPYFGLSGPSGASNSMPLNSASLNAEPRIGGFGSPWAPSRLDAHEVIAAEFGGVLPASEIRAVADHLHGVWMWRLHHPTLAVESAERTTAWPDVSAAILARLSALEAAIRDLRPGHGEMGHNAPPTSSGLTADDEREAYAAIASVRAAISSPGNSSSAELQAAAGSLATLRGKLGSFALGLSATFWTEAAKSAGAEAGKGLVRVLVAGELIRELQPLLDVAARMLGHH